VFIRKSNITTLSEISKALIDTVRLENLYISARFNNYKHSIN